MCRTFFALYPNSGDSKLFKSDSCNMDVYGCDNSPFHLHRPMACHFSVFNPVVVRIGGLQLARFRFCSFRYTFGAAAGLHVTGRMLLSFISLLFSNVACRIGKDNFYANVEIYPKLVSISPSGRNTQSITEALSLFNCGLEFLNPEGNRFL
jgi:hypothetical protein